MPRTSISTRQTHMSAGALVEECGLGLGTKPSLEISDTEVVWRIGQRCFRRLRLRQKADFVVSTTFKGLASVATIHGDFVQLFGEDGSFETFGLPFKPANVLSCQYGLVLSFSNKLFLARSAQLLVSLISPTSNTKWMPNERLLHFGSSSTDIAVSTYVNEAGQRTIRLYRIRFLEFDRARIPNQSISRRPVKRHSIAGSSGRRKISSLRHHDAAKFTTSETTDVQDMMPTNLVKNATFSFIGSYPWKFDSEITVLAQRAGSLQALFLFSEKDQVVKLLVYDEFDKLLTDVEIPARSVALLEGIKVHQKDYPFALFQSPDGKVYLHSAFLVDHSTGPGLLILDAPNDVLEEELSNCFVLKSRKLLKLKQYRLRLSSMSSALQKVLSVVSSLLDAKQTYSLLLSILFLRENQPMLSDWERFCVVTSGQLYSKGAFGKNIAEIKGGFQFITTHIIAGLPQHVIFPDLSKLMVYLHLWHEESLLTHTGAEDENRLAMFLTWLCLQLRWVNWLRYYNHRDFPFDEEIQQKVSSVRDGIPPSILDHLRFIIDDFKSDYPKYAVTSHAFPVSAMCIQLFEQLKDPYKSQRLTLSFLDDQREKSIDFHNLIDCVKIPLAVVLCALRYQYSESSMNSEQDLKLLGRTDLLKLLFPGKNFNSLDRPESITFVEGLKDVIKKTTSVIVPANTASPQDISRLVYSTDRRFHEAAKLLQTSKPQVISIGVDEAPESIGETEWFEVKQAVAHILKLRTLASAFGNAALYLSSLVPAVTERVAIDTLQLDVRVLNDQSTVAHSATNKLKPILHCGEFAHGVMTGLRISQDSAGLSGRWILNCKQQENMSDDRYAGFLLGLGFSRHLDSLEDWQIYGYLGDKNSLTAVGALLGLCISKRGAAEFKLTKVLSLHIRPLLPANSNDLKVSVDIEAAAILGMGILHECSKNRHLSEVLATELLSGEGANDDSYFLACGIALGLLNRGGASYLSTEDDLVEKLMRPVRRLTDIPVDAVQLRSCDFIIISIMIMFMGSNSRSLASKLAPATPQSVLLYIKPMQLFLRVLARNLILWDSIKESTAWMESAILDSLPCRYLDQWENLDSDNLFQVAVIGAVCTAVCIRFAGSNSQTVISFICNHLDKMWVLLESWPSDDSTDDERLTWSNLSQIHSSMLTAVSFVAAGTGDLQIMKRARRTIQHVSARLRSTDDYTVFNEYACANMAIGILFLGEGQFVLSQDRQSAVYLAISILPSFVQRSNYLKWSFLKFFWTIARRNRRLVVRDVATNAIVQAEAVVTGNKQEARAVTTPAVLPDTCSLSALTISAPEYLTVSLDLTNERHRKSLEKAMTVYIQKNKDFSTEISARVQRTTNCLMNMPKSTERDALHPASGPSDPSQTMMKSSQLLLSFYIGWIKEYNSILEITDLESLELAYWRAQHPQAM